MKADLPKLAALEDEASIFDDLNPAPRLLMGPGPINADPRVLRAMSAQLIGQFDPQFRVYMKETMELYRRVLETRNRWTFLIDGTARCGDRVRDGLGGRARRPRAGARVRPLRTTEGGDRAPRRRRPARRGGGVGHRVLARAGRGGGEGVPAEARRHLPGRHLDHDGAAARGDRQDLPPPRGDAPGRRDGDPRRHAARRGRLGDRLRHGRPAEVPRRPVGLGADHLERAHGRSDLPAPSHRGGPAAEGLRARRGPHDRLELLRPRDADGLLERSRAQPSHRGDDDALRRAGMRPHLRQGRPGERVPPPRARQPGDGRGRRGDGAEGVRRQGAQDAERHRHPHSRRA